jgi:hypothetical protein
MRKKRLRLPKWLRSLQTKLPAESKPSKQPATWQENLWRHMRSLESSPLVLQGELYYPVPVGGSAVISTPSKEIRCGLSRPVVSSQGTHGLHLFLIDEARSERAVALLLTPATFARLQARSREYPNIRPYSLTERLAILETATLRGEFLIRDIAYGQEIPERDLLQALAIEVSVWRSGR